MLAVFPCFPAYLGLNSLTQLAGGVVERRTSRRSGNVASANGSCPALHRVWRAPWVAGNVPAKKLG